MKEQKIEDFLKENNADSEFIRELIDHMWLISSTEIESAEELLSVLKKWVCHYRHENMITENLVFPCIEEII